MVVEIATNASVGSGIDDLRDGQIRSFSFPFRFLIEAFLASRLSGRPHEPVATLAFLSEQGLTFRRDNFLDRPQIGKERLVGGMGA